MFMGTHHPRLDVKGRLALPARFRPDLATGVVITKGQERCLYAFTLVEFERITAALATAPLTARGARDYTRVFFGSAFPDTLDGQGRITIPAALRTYAGLTKDCAVIGANTRVEIWDAGAWDTFLTESEPAFADAVEEVIPGVL